MIDASQIIEAAAKVKTGDLSMHDFERWFRFATFNFCLWADKRTKDLIMAVENVLTDDAGQAQLEDAIQEHVK